MANINRFNPLSLMNTISIAIITAIIPNVTRYNKIVWSEW